MSHQNNLWLDKNPEQLKKKENFKKDLPKNQDNFNQTYPELFFYKYYEFY